MMGPEVDAKLRLMSVLARLCREELEAREEFDAEPGVLRALRRFRELDGDPPWEHASALLSDGLIDVGFALTARGRRAVARQGGG